MESDRPFVCVCVCVCVCARPTAQAAVIMTFEVIQVVNSLKGGR